MPGEDLTGVQRQINSRSANSTTIPAAAYHCENSIATTQREIGILAKWWVLFTRSKYKNQLKGHSEGSHLLLVQTYSIPSSA